MIDSCDDQSDFIPIVSTPWDSSWPELAREDDRRHLFCYLEDRFGIPERLFDDYLLFKRGKNWWLLRNSHLIMSVSRLKVSIVGLRAFNQIGEFVKPTTRMIQVFGHCATMARLEIGEGQLWKLAAGKIFPVDMEIENGYVILSLKGQPLGLGLFINGMIRSQIPRKELRLMTMKPSFLSRNRKKRLCKSFD